MNLAMREAALRRPRDVELHGPEAFAAMRKSGRLTAEILDFITPYVRPGVTTELRSTACAMNFIWPMAPFPAR